MQLLQPGAPCVHFHSTLLAHSYAIRLKCTWVQSSSIHTGITPQAARQHACISMIASMHHMQAGK